MERDCFLCGSETETLVRNLWPLPGLPASPIGFGVCRGCGMVLQSPSVEPEAMRSYYADTAVYTNPGRGGQPHRHKVAGMDRTLTLLARGMGGRPASVFQVGCSDGYTLHRLARAGVRRTCGIDPGAASCALARERYGVDVQEGVIEELEPDAQGEPFELVILSHVLEHLYDPLDGLRRCARMLARGGWALVEVPLLEGEEHLPPGYFSFEHLNYFSVATLQALLLRAGYEAVWIDAPHGIADYPVITVLARKSSPRPYPSALAGRHYPRARALVERYFAGEAARWAAVERRLHRRIEPGSELWVWGAGIHTSQLFAFTDLESRWRVRGLLDSSPTKWGKRLGPHLCHDPASVALGDGDRVLISSFASEDEIWAGLEAGRARGVRVERLYGGATA